MVNYVKNLLRGLFCVGIMVSQGHAIIVHKDFGLEKSEKLAGSYTHTCWVGATFTDGRGSQSTGVLISPTEVLTAAHPLRGGSELKKCFAIFHGEKGTVMSAGIVTGVAVHPEFKNDSTHFSDVDLAILTLAEPVKGITPVSLWGGEAHPESAYIVGYGDGGVSDEGVTKVQSDKPVRRMGATRISTVEADYITYGFTPMKWEGRMPDTFKVEADTLKYQSIPMGGDSGGPLLVNHKGTKYLAGICRGVQGMYTEGASVFAMAKWTNLQTHRAWIMENSDATWFTPAAAAGGAGSAKGGAGGAAASGGGSSS